MAKTKNNLVIVESPTKSKTIEKFLGKNYTVTASMGHLRDLPKSTFGVDVENGFEPKYINIRGKGPLIKDLKNMAKNADKVYLATDPDREGEAISWHLAHILGIEPDSACRIEFHEITNTAVKDAIKHPRVINMPMVDAQQTRRILDRIVGYQLSPLLWRKIRKGLSAGRVQSVAVKIVADRDKEIADFVPQEYWTINAKLRENAKAPIFEAEAAKYKGKKLEMHTAAEAQAVEAALAKAAYVIGDSAKKERKRHPVPPFTTSSLQQEANKKLGFTAKKTMMVAQQLYEGVALGKSSVGMITYMRTDSVRLADEAIADIRGYIENNYGSEYCPAKPNHYSAKKNAQDAHEAIRPTSVLRTPDEVARHLSKDQIKLYTLIWNRAVASQMSDAIFDVTTLTINAYTDKESVVASDTDKFNGYQLRASGSIMKFPGFLALLGKSAEDEKDKTVPFLEKGTAVKLHKLLPAEQHFTEPPAHFTEATLVKELEEKGIGRPSTYAPTIQTILDRGYVGKEGKKLLITELGLTTIDMLTEYFSGLINIPFSAQLEGELDDIAESKVQMLQVLENFYGGFAKDLKRADSEIEAVEIPVVVSDVQCEKCGRMMVIKEGRFGKFLACPGFPDCRNTKPILKKIGVKCPTCGAEIVERKSRGGKLFYGCEKYPECDYTTWDRPLTENCAKCGSMLVEHIERNGRRHNYCSNQSCVDARPLPKPKADKTAEATAEKEKPVNKATVRKTATKKTTAKKTTVKKTTKKS